MHQPHFTATHHSQTDFPMAVCSLPTCVCLLTTCLLWLGSVWVRRRVLCTTPMGNVCELLTITDFHDDATAFRRRKGGS